jgi:hypothetical protein
MLIIKYLFYYKNNYNIYTPYNILYYLLFYNNYLYYNAYKKNKLL